MIKRLIWVVSIALTACGQPPSTEPSIAGAYEECKAMALQVLKAPATAEFASLDDIEAVGMDISAPDGPTKKEFKILGYVDAQNSFGAKLRNQFSCNITGWSGNVWVIDSFKILD
jgi:hypothetical protein